MAGAVASLAQLSFVWLFSSHGAPSVRMEISDENARPISVAITPVPKLGGGAAAAKAMRQWERRPPPETPLPSPHAEHSPTAIPTNPVADAAVTPPTEDAGPVAATTDAAVVESDASVPGPGVPTGVADGGDPLKELAKQQYRNLLIGWFLARFNIKG